MLLQEEVIPQIIEIIKRDNMQDRISGLRESNSRDIHELSLVYEVCKDVGHNDGIHVLFHSGKPYENFAHTELGVMILSENMFKLFTDQEAKAYIAHEIDHLRKVKAQDRIHNFLDEFDQETSSPKREKIDELYRKRGIAGPFSEQKKAAIKGRYSAWFEGAADDLAAKTYGHKTMATVLKKICAMMVREDDSQMAVLFPDMDAEGRAKVTEEQLHERIDKLAKTPIRRDDSERLWRLKRLVQGEQSLLRC